MGHLWHRVAGMEWNGLCLLGLPVIRSPWRMLELNMLAWFLVEKLLVVDQQLQCKAVKYTGPMGLIQDCEQFDCFQNKLLSSRTCVVDCGVVWN